MCGIIGCVRKEGTVQKETLQDVLIEGLTALRYRGYDSAGIATVVDNEIVITKEKGKIDELKKILKPVKSNLGIGHTRWATNGDPSNENSHPHKQGKITIVHNGIIENADFLKKNLQNIGYMFKSETDTEVAAALLDKLYSDAKDINTALIEFQEQVEGAYALGIIIDDDYNSLYAIRKNSPLVIALGNNENYIASDVPAIIKYTNKYISLDNGDFAKIQGDYVQCYDKNGQKIEKEIKEFPISSYNVKLNGYKTMMLKEMHEQPDVMKNIFNTYLGNGIDSLVETMPDFSKYNKIIITACGSAWHAGLVGKHMIEEFADIPVDVEIASEFRYKKSFFDNNTLVIGVSQSGETADTIRAIEDIAKAKGADTLGIINQENSTMSTVVDFNLYTKAGAEVAVASTKAYSAQVALLSLIALNIANHKKNIDNDELKEILQAARNLPLQLEKIQSDQYADIYDEITENLCMHNSIFYIGRGIDYNLCLEGSLKLKEITYIHSEAYAAGELKHGTISLIEPPKYAIDKDTKKILKDENNNPVIEHTGTPVIGIMTDNTNGIAAKTWNNLEETRTRGSQNYVIITEDLDQFYSQNEKYNKLYKKIVIPKTHKIFQPVITVGALQKIAYKTAEKKGVDIDQPRHLAKAVTVE